MYFLGSVPSGSSGLLKNNVGTRNPINTGVYTRDSGSPMITPNGIQIGSRSNLSYSTGEPKGYTRAYQLLL